MVISLNNPLLGFCTKERDKNKKTNQMESKQQENWMILGHTDIIILFYPNNNSENS